MHLHLRHRRRLLITCVVAMVIGGTVLGATQLAGRAGATTGRTLSAVPGPAQQALHSQYGITVASAATTASDVASDQAINAAKSSFGALGGDASSIVAVRVRFTDPHYGTVTEGPNNTVSPFNVNEDAWLVLIPHTTNFIYGPPGSAAPSAYTATLAVFVNARDGSVIEAQTIPDS